MKTDDSSFKRAANLLIGQINNLSQKPMRIMEVCGTHTTAIFKAGVRQVLPPTVELVSGPGCPVCVTANDYLDTAIAYAANPGVIIATFGDMLRVPGSRSTLLEAKFAGANVRIVYSPMEAIVLAGQNSDKQVIFLAVGFETTAPVVAATIVAAKKSQINNLFFLTAHKRVEPALKALLASPAEDDKKKRKIDGFLLPGHVCAVTGVRAFDFLAEEFKTPAVATGFEPLDILEGIYLLVKEIAAGQAGILNQYRRVVKDEGNKVARQIIEDVFRFSDANWRGLGLIKDSGLVLKKEYEDFDALKNLTVSVEPPVEPVGCRCPEVLTGYINPVECPLFGKLCLPEHPVGVCMVSSEGACSAWYKYRAGR